MDFSASCDLIFVAPAKRFTRDWAQPNAIRRVLVAQEIGFACGAPTTTPTHRPLKDRQSLQIFHFTCACGSRTRLCSLKGSRPDR
jgi:hypothetical protein